MSPTRRTPSTAVRPARPRQRAGGDPVSGGLPAADRIGSGGGSQTIATVVRAADVLMLFARRDTPLGITEISTELALSKAAVHRILASLRGVGLVQLDEDTRLYALGPGALALGLAYLHRLDVRDLAAPELAELSHETQETATLSVRTGTTRMYVDQVVPQREVAMRVALGVQYPLHAGGSSKAFLAFLPAQEVEDYLAAGPLPALTEHTLIDPASLRTELATIRELGYATSVGERQAGAASAAAPVFDHQGLPAAVVSVSGPAERFRGELDACLPLLLAATGRLSSRLGHQLGDGVLPSAG